MGMRGLHAFPCGFDHRVRRRHDVARRAVIGGQVRRLRAVVGLETPDELNRRAVEGIDVLIVVAHSEQGELARIVLQRPAGQGRDQVVLLGTDILVLVDKNPAETREQAIAAFVRLFLHQPLAHGARRPHDASHP